ncbi:hypothetical protein, partial [Acidiphilium sp.]|uniref:hypothetical protein n=1 Tax=Acidiphilium sp. TaxID=527 RepID=UPI002583E866
SCAVSGSSPVHPARSVAAASRMRAAEAMPVRQLAAGHHVTPQHPARNAGGAGDVTKFLVVPEVNPVLNFGNGLGNHTLR